MNVMPKTGRGLWEGVKSTVGLRAGLLGPTGRAENVRAGDGLKALPGRRPGVNTNMTSL